MKVAKIIAYRKRYFLQQKNRQTKEHLEGTVNLRFFVELERYWAIGVGFPLL